MPLKEVQCAALRAAAGADSEVRFDEPMSRHTTLRIGGPADAWIAPADEERLAAIRRRAGELGLAHRALGAGSNLLVKDGGIRGVVLSLRKLSAIRVVEEAPDSVQLAVAAGVSTGKLLSFATRGGLGGVEFLGGVPGTVGGGLIMNAGTYLGEFKDVTQSLFSVDVAGERVTRTLAECGFAYRHSDIPLTDVVTGALLGLPRRPRSEIEAAVTALRARRKEREPHSVPNAGSIFKNPPGDFAGRLIEACGCKSRRVGGVQVSPAHANWLVNIDAGNAREFLQLAHEVREAVRAQFGITLEFELKILGEDA